MMRLLVDILLWPRTVWHWLNDPIPDEPDWALGIPLPARRHHP